MSKTSLWFKIKKAQSWAFIVECLKQLATFAIVVAIVCSMYAVSYGLLFLIVRSIKYLVTKYHITISNPMIIIYVMIAAVIGFIVGSFLRNVYRELKNRGTFRYIERTIRKEEEERSLEK